MHNQKPKDHYVAVNDRIGKKLMTVRKYISKFFAVSGSGGHRNTYRAACKIADAIADERQVLAELLRWNETNAHPLWSEKELEHKAHDACHRKERT